MKKLVKNLIAAAAGAFGLVYLLNPTLGMFELIPDVLPGVGNLDEAAATALVLAALSYFGVDLSRIFRGMRKTGSGAAKKPPTVIDADEVPAKEDA